jgi:endoglucanase
MKEGGGGDNLAIAWEYPGQRREVIPARFSRVANPFEDLWTTGAMLDTWTGLNSGNTIADLMFSTAYLASFPNKSVRLVDLLEGPTNVGDNYGSRMRGWLVPPVTGNFVFWIASDDNGEFWLSTNNRKANEALICLQPQSAGPRQWDKYTEQKSQPIRLVAGQAYYYEVRGSLCV